MKARAVAAIAVLSCAIVSGGWLVQRGLVSTAHPAASRDFDGAHLFAQVLERVQQTYVDSAVAGDVYRKALERLMLELDDPHSALLT